MCPLNKKIRNAQKIVYDNIEFKSKSEASMYKMLLEAGFSPKYECNKFILWNGFKPRRPIVIDGIKQLTKNGKIPSIPDWTYTPDFYINYNGYDIYIEIKGFPNDVYPYKKKLFLKNIDNIDNILFFEVRNINGMKKTIEIIKSYELAK